MLSVGGLFLGITILIAGGFLLVHGASEIATKLGVPPLFIGLTVVGFGTSAPELIINIAGALSDATSLAFGNVIGSNISNLALILGAAALMSPITIQGTLVRREVPLLLLATSVVLVMALDGPLEDQVAMISRSESIVLLVLFCIFLYISVMDILALRTPDPILADIQDNPFIDMHLFSRHRWLLVFSGTILLALGGEITVRSGMAISESFGISEAVVGLIFIAVGTSMPELATSIIAVVRKESDLALGNIVGSNIFNTLIVLPAGGMISQIPIPPGGVGDIILSWFLTALLIPIFFLGDGRLDRKLGVVLLLAYFSYVFLRIYLE